jgi:hypothetical protein
VVVLEHEEEETERKNDHDTPGEPTSPTREAPEHETGTDYEHKGQGAQHTTEERPGSDVRRCTDPCRREEPHENADEAAEDQKDAEKNPA